MGVEEPQSLAEWADVGLGCNRLPWLQGQDLLRLKRMLESFQLTARRSLLTGQPLGQSVTEVC